MSSSSKPMLKHKHRWGCDPHSGSSDVYCLDYDATPMCDAELTFEEVAFFLNANAKAVTDVLHKKGYHFVKVE